MPMSDTLIVPQPGPFDDIARIVARIVEEAFNQADPETKLRIREAIAAADQVVELAKSLTDADPSTP